MYRQPSSEFSGSATSSFLGPLNPPYRSPYGLDWLEEDPPEFGRQQYQEARRKSTKLLNVTYRKVLQQLGLASVREQQPWPPREETANEHLKLSNAKTFYSGPPLRLPSTSKAKRGLAPKRMLASSGSASQLGLSSAGFSQHLANTSATSATQWTPGATSPQKLARSESEGDVYRPIPSSGRHKETVSRLHGWGRGSCGGPFTYGQVFEQIDARVQHRPARDCRAPMGRLGPLQIGNGTQRVTRDLPELRRVSKSSGGEERSSSAPRSSGGIWAKRSQQLALTC